MVPVTSRITKGIHNVRATAHVTARAGSVDVFRVVVEHGRDYDHRQREQHVQRDEPGVELAVDNQSSEHCVGDDAKDE
jgi:hypothetical protein